jgi:hypothetical protein
MTPKLLRGLAILIALAGAIDPTVTSERRTRPEIAIVAADEKDDELARQVADTLSRDFTIVRGPYTAAAAVVAVGETLSPASVAFPDSVPAFAVLPTPTGPLATIEAVRVPARAPLNARVPVTAVVRARGARSRSVHVSLLSNDIVIDRASRPVDADDERIEMTLGLVPTARGAQQARLVAEIDGTPGRSSSDLLVDVIDTRWSVLFFDRRPSWMSTFVRRAIESDARFVASSRVVTSRNVTVETGSAPGSLADLDALSLHEAIVVGAPHELTTRDVDGLAAFLRLRGGTVVLLCDERTPGPYERFLATPRWATASSAHPAALRHAGTDGARIHASELTWPVALPAAAQVLAETESTEAGTTGRRPIVWRVPAGAGRVIVSGALDAWRFRTHAESAFDRFWQSIVADAAAAAAPRVSVTVSRAVVQPGESTEVDVTLRDVALADLSSGRPLGATVSASIEHDSARIPVSLWPDHEPGRLRGSVRVPPTAGPYRIVVTSGGARADAALAVVPDAAHPAPDERDLIAAWTHSRRGAVIPAQSLPDLPSMLVRSLAPVSRPVTWHPMRSPWWLVPFASGLGVEWWWRRRHGRR